MAARGSEKGTVVAACAQAGRQAAPESPRPWVHRRGAAWGPGVPRRLLGQRATL